MSCMHLDTWGVLMARERILTRKIRAMIVSLSTGMPDPDSVKIEDARAIVAQLFNDLNRDMEQAVRSVSSIPHEYVMDVDNYQGNAELRKE